MSRGNQVGPKSCFKDSLSVDLLRSSALSPMELPFVNFWKSTTSEISLGEFPGFRRNNVKKTWVGFKTILKAHKQSGITPKKILSGRKTLVEEPVFNQYFASIGKSLNANPP